MSTTGTTTPPEGATVPARSASAPEPGQPIASHYRECFGCGEDHPTGLHMRIQAGEGLTVRGDFHVTEHHQGAPGLAHGGVLSVAIDEVVGSLNWLLASPAVTARLECDFRMPVPVGSRLCIEAEITGVQGRKVYTRATGRLGEWDGPVAISASALFVQVPLQHFLDHGDPELVQQAIVDRANGGPAWRPAGTPVEVNP